MISFKEYLDMHAELNEDTNANTHSTHIEDLVFKEGVKGINKALGGLISVAKQFGKTSSSQVSNITVKIDGAPAFFAGYLGTKFFVATKGLFAKTPKINFSDEDIDRNHSGELAEKVKLGLKYLKQVIPKGKIFQGDFLFDEKSKSSANIDGISSWTFQPNTIEYTVEKESPLGKKIGKAKFGIIFHTEYISDGVNPESIHLKGFGVKESDLIASNDVWFTDAYHHNLGSITSLTTNEYKQIELWKNSIRQLQSKVDWSILSKQNVTEQLMVFVNTYIRNNITQPIPAIKAKEFKTYIINKSEKAIDSKKSERGKLSETKKWEDVLFIADDSKSLSALFEIHDILTKFKEFLIVKLDTVKKLKTFLVKSNGDIEVTGSEGFVITNTSAKSTKLVSRYTFSKANFSSEYKKGWTHK